MQNNNSLSLSQLIFQVQYAINQTFMQAVWVVAEISELNINYSGHCYLELIEKDQNTDKILAKSRATIWAGAFRIIKPYFETTTRETLKAGLKVLVKVTVEFHELYGFSLNVVDIDPSYTVGDMAVKRALIIEKLKQEGVFEMNKIMEIPMVPQRIAVISSETAAGFGDFNEQLISNHQGYSFSIVLFPAIMQGQNATPSIINAFNQIFNAIDNFDVVVLIRGGGSKIDLSCFDDYDLAYFITQFPLPVITGIGHERDESITDMVAHTHLKTPTAVAEFIIDKLDAFNHWLNQAFDSLILHLQETVNHESNYLNDLSGKLQYQAKNIFQMHLLGIDSDSEKLKRAVLQNLKSKSERLRNLNLNISLVAKSKVKQTENMCSLYQTRLNKWSRNAIIREQVKLNAYHSKLELINPQNVLKRGFALVTSNGRVVKNASKLKTGDRVNIQFEQGSAESEIKNTMP